MRTCNVPNKEVVMKVTTIDPGCFGGRCYDCDRYIGANELLAIDEDGEEFCADCSNVLDPNFSGGVYDFS